MDRRVAMELLGLEPDEQLTHDRVRRAYLRRLRVHSPERDPDGFRRLREAFEAIEPFARMHDAMTGAGTEASAIRIEPAPREASDRPREHRTRDEVLGDLSTPSDPLDTPQRAARDADDEPPEPPELPEPPEPPGPENSLDAPAPLESDPPPSLGAVTDEILALLQRHGMVDAALDLRDRWNRRAVDDHRAVSPYVALRWALTRELLEIAAALPSSLRAAIAQGIAADRLASARAAAEDHQSMNPQRARDIARHMAKRAPSLYKVLGPVLLRGTDRFDTADRQQPRSGRSIAWGLWVVIAVVSALTRASTCGDSSRSHDVDHEQRREIQIDPATLEKLRHGHQTPRPRFDETGLLDLRTRDQGSASLPPASPPSSPP